VPNCFNQSSATKAIICTISKPFSLLIKRKNLLALKKYRSPTQGNKQQIDGAIWGIQYLKGRAAERTGELGCSGGGSAEESGGRGEETSHDGSRRGWICYFGGELTPILLPAWRRETNTPPPRPPGAGAEAAKGAAPQGRGSGERAQRGCTAARDTGMNWEDILVNSLLP
jgi:hypothetical protein